MPLVVRGAMQRGDYAVANQIVALMVESGYAMSFLTRKLGTGEEFR